jgi:hypothetical protein
MVDGEWQSFAGAIPLAHWLLFFIIGDCSSVIRCELGDITPIKQGGTNYEIPTGYPTYETTSSRQPNLRRG